MTHLIFLASRTLAYRWGSLLLLLLTISGALGLQVSNSANLEGYSQELLTKGVLPATGHIRISAHAPGPGRGRAQLLARLGSTGAIAAATPQYIQPTVLFYRGTRLPTQAIGILPSAEEQAQRLCHRLSRGHCITQAGARQLVLGHALAADLNVNPGDELTVLLPFEDLDSLRFMKDRFRVAGVLAPFGGFVYLEWAVFLHIDELAALQEEQDVFTNINIYLKSEARQSEALPQIQALVSSDLRVQPWSQATEGLSALLQSSRRVNSISQIMVIFAILLPTLALLWINVMREQHQIAALEAIGFTRLSIFVVYLLRAGLIGLLGSVLGMLLGLLLCWYFRAHPIYAQAGFGIAPLLRPVPLLESVGLAFGIAMLGGLAPALRAAFANPSLTMRVN